MKQRRVRLQRQLLLVLLDLAIVGASLSLGLLLRFEGQVSREAFEAFLRYGPVILALYAALFVLFRLYTILWRYAGGSQYLYQAGVVFLGGILSLLLNHLADWGLSRSVLALTCLFSMGLLVASRLFARSFRARQAAWRKAARRLEKAPPLMIVGAGDAGNYVVRQAKLDHRSFGRPAVFVDDAPEKLGLSVQGIPVLGSVEQIPSLVEEHGIRNIVIAMPSVQGERMREVIAVCNATRCRVRMLSDPQSVEEQYRRGSITVREPNIADFLSRDEVQIDSEEVSAYLKGKTVMVTGGGGSIGSEICRQVMKHSPGLLLIFDMYENCAYELLIELQQEYGADCPVEVLVGSVRDRGRLDEVMERYRPQVLFHAAAHKHVPLMEKSPGEAVKNNVLGTLNLLESAAAHGVGRFVQLSTDKAVNPTNIMGATKRVTELLVQRFARATPMKCMAVRFGNVLGSHGSVIPLFEKQIRGGGPVTLTHPEITRYFMTIPEAAQLVLLAGSMEDPGAIYILDMGEPVSILELARNLIRFHGFEPDVDMPIVITGLRPGEKLHEELLLEAEMGALKKTAHQKILIAPPFCVDEALFESQLNRLEEAARAEPDRIQSILQEMLHDYRDTQEEQAGAAVSAS